MEAMVQPAALPVAGKIELAQLAHGLSVWRNGTIRGDPVSNVNGSYLPREIQRIDTPH